MSKFAGVLKSVKGAETASKAESTPTLVTVRRGRPKGKRSDPSYEQVTAYIQKETYRRTKMALLQNRDDRDFSQLVEDLLCTYLRTQKST